MTHADDMRQRQLDIEEERRLHAAAFDRFHPEYRNGPPPSQWPALLQGLPDPIAAAFAPLIVKGADK